jgi:hypothetical protein
MEQQLSVLLYSKYSQHSKRLMDMIQNSPIDLTSDNVGLNFICIDNKDIRLRIVKSKQLDINVVPCILIVYKDGGVEKYDGANAFQWVEEIIIKLSPPPPSPKLISEPVQTPVQKPNKNKKDYIKSQSRIKKYTKPIKQGSTPIEDLDDEDEDDEDEDEDDEDEDDEDEDEGPPPVKRPPVSIRSDAGNYDIQEEFGTIDEPNRQVTRGIKSSSEPAVSKKKADLMSTAMAMQKLREKEDSNRKTVGMTNN